MVLMIMDLGIKSFSHLFVAVLLLLVRPAYVYGQTSTLCSSSMLQSFNPCINYLANSNGSGSGSSPTADCCDSLKSFMGSGKDCLCLILTGGIALRIPINRTLAASLPRACKTSGVPIECKALPGVPIPAPGPAVFNPPPPSWLPDPNPPALAPPGNAAGGDRTLTPPRLTPDIGGFPAMTPPGVRPDLSAAQPSARFSHLTLIALVLFGSTGAIAFNYF